MGWFSKKEEAKHEKPICRHLWVKTHKVRKPTGDIWGSYETYIYLYCPRCDTRERVTETEWIIRSNEQSIRESWSELQLKDELFSEWFNTKMKEWERNGKN